MPEMKSPLEILIDESRSLSERTALEREVIELGKRWWFGSISDSALRAKIADLIEFESQHKQ